MTLAAEQWPDAHAAASWRLTPGLALALDDAETRERLYAILPEPPPQYLHGLIVALTHREMRYRRALWDEGIEEGNDRYENIYRCASTLDDLTGCPAPEAEEIARDIRAAFVDGEWEQWQSGWERRQSGYYWPT